MIRGRLVLFALLAMLVVVVVSVWLVWPRTAITRENAARIREGMTLTEVEGILGGPSRDESSGHIEPDDEHVVLYPPAVSPAISQRWDSDYVAILLTYNADWRVTEVNVIPVHREHDGLLQMLRRWLRM